MWPPCNGFIGSVVGDVYVSQRNHDGTFPCDGSSETLTPAEFEQKFCWHNDPAKVRLTD
jgi:hypothetical protein